MTALTIPEGDELELIRQTIDDSVLTHTGRSVGDRASGKVARDVLVVLEDHIARQVVAARLDENRYWLDIEETTNADIERGQIEERIAALKPSGIPVSKADYVRLADEVREIEEEKSDA